MSSEGKCAPSLGAPIVTYVAEFGGDMAKTCLPKGTWVTFAGKKHNKHLPTPFTNTLHLVIACLIFGK